MDKIILANGAAYNMCAVASLGREFDRGANREIMTLQFLPGEFGSFEQFSKAFRDRENLELVQLQNEAGEIFSHEGFVLFSGAELKEALISEEDSKNAAVYEERYILKLGRMTYSEWQYDELMRLLSQSGQK